ncbi:hypothetical protein BH09PSE5_BH09PSE5_44220 [soil metagenome]
MKTIMNAANKAKPIRTAAAVLLSAIALTACGGGGGDDVPAAVAAVPPEASQSSLSFTEYVRQLVASVNVDEFLPVDLSAVTNPPETNDVDPQVLQ